MASNPSSSAPTGSSPPNWRDGIQQSFRNNEVREISKVLASVEPGATAASKLRIAMQFEADVFQKADSLEDYRKRISKRLKKLQQNYKPTNDPSATAKEQIVQEIRLKHGQGIQYILQHAGTAVTEAGRKYGQERAKQLRESTDSIKEWAKDLGITNTAINAPPNYTLSLDRFKTMQTRLDRVLENIRLHIVKLSDGETFLTESLQKTESKLKGDASQLLAQRTLECYKKKVSPSEPLNPESLFREALQASQQPVPTSTRNQNNKEQAALVYVRKLRAASSVLFSFMVLSQKEQVPTSTLVKTHNMVMDGIKLIQEVIIELRKNNTRKRCSLEDAWMKSMPSQKKHKTTNHVATHSRVLLTAGRKCPPNILPALEAKGAQLHRPPPNGQGTHLIIHFEKAFSMTIYFQPLVVSLRAYDGKVAAKTSHNPIECAEWAPLHQGLPSQEKLSVYSATGPYSAVGPLVEERLRDASAELTQILRQSFAQAYREKESLFETEVREASALLEFLTQARQTYLEEEIPT